RILHVPVGRPSAIGYERVPSDKGATLRGEKQSDVSHFFGLTQTAKRRTLAQRFHVQSTSPDQLLNKRSACVAWTYGIHTDAIRRPFHGQRFGQRDHPCLGCAIGCALRS